MKRILLLTIIAGATAGSLFGDNGRVSLDQVLRPLELAVTVGEKVSSADPRGTPGSVFTKDPVSFSHLALKDILPGLNEWMQSYFEEEGQFAFHPIRGWNGIRIPAQVEWDIIWGLEVRPDSRGMIHPEFSIRAGDKEHGPWRLAIRMEVLREVWVARQRLGRGDSPFRPKVEPAMINVLSERGNPIPAHEDLSGHELVQVVGEGRVLNWADLAPRPSVRRGQVVEVALLEGALHIRMKAQAMEEGRAGDIVVVRNLQSRQEFQALVVGENLVRVHL